MTSNEKKDLLPVDLDGLRTELAEVGAEEILPELVETFVSDAPLRMEAITTALEAGGRQKIRTAAHAYKSAAGTMRAHALAALLLELEMAGNEGDVERAIALQPAVQEAHEQALVFLSNAPGSGDGDG
jgi:HPt (histidine-containing phosphotransfer) domain-containing protein